MAAENGNPCDPDDVACQAEVLERLKQFQEIAKDSVFLEKYPQLEGLETQIAEDVVKQEAVVQRTIDDCTPGSTAEKPVEISVKADTVLEEASVFATEEGPHGE